LDPEGKAILDVYGQERDRLVRIAKTTSMSGVRREERDGAEWLG
jgi:hypothetical protein